MAMTPFCCNAKCHMHAFKASPGQTCMMKPPTGPSLGMVPVNTKVHIGAIDRHKIMVGAGGQLIEDYLCDTCMEVFRMVEGNL
jgi:hypothetical protein